MREWFKAFKDQNTTHRDYRPYFKPVLCYLEGAWTRSTDKLEEFFESDKHFIDAETWYDLQEQIRFTSYTGKKASYETLDYLPTTVMELINGTIPYVAQWNYRILCHPLKNYLPINRMRPVDDLATRMRQHGDFHEYEDTRAARFQLNPIDSDEWSTVAPQLHLLDSLMAEVPGKDNYPANITTNAYPLYGLHKRTPLNAGYYRRFFRTRAMNDDIHVAKSRGSFNDQNIFMAATTNSKVAPISATFCRWGRRCKTYTERWTYAIPLEIIYLTPLSSWNPYNLQYKGETGSKLAREVTANVRRGDNSTDNAFDGISSTLYFMTPAEFYSGMEAYDPTDTSIGPRWVLDPSRTPRKVSTSGVRINMQEIPGVGVVRQRYPVMPIHEEGNTIYKELEALKDIVLEAKNFVYMLRDSDTDIFEKGFTLKMLPSTPEFGSHEHLIHLTGKEVQRLYSGILVKKVTNMINGHQHEVLFERRIV